MRIVIKPPKPRNPFAVSARQRRGNVHGSYQPARRDRHAARNELERLLKNEFGKGE
ncbi:hypothetical protein EDC30_107135 [Paucimonas lemoignei]|uniref:Uncharacterized protein n=1 Tax=Paucimonas lemoignei TaxID=29443 RepID=A0A4R3HTK0_PAULE|nr:hypothetical protein [Paucimonas lemoignei]TCS36318.1 hypothetical protein EDC30_107135 [Paucimonas lemoignei]